MHVARIVILVKMLLLGWSIVWCTVVVSPRWVATFSQLPPLLLCAFSAGISLAHRWIPLSTSTKKNRDNTLTNNGLTLFERILVIISALSAAVVGTSILVSIHLHCNGVMNSVGDPVFAAACLDERLLLWTFALSALGVALLDIIYFVILSYSRGVYCSMCYSSSSSSNS
jgi:hypothetical protein